MAEVLLQTPGVHQPDPEWAGQIDQDALGRLDSNDQGGAGCRLAEVQKSVTSISVPCTIGRAGESKYNKLLILLHSSEI